MRKDIINQFKTIDMTWLDKTFITSFSMFVAFMLYYGASILTVGGIILIYGAFLTYKGQIFLATASYLLADSCWIYNAWIFNDVQGVIFIAIGIFFGVMATYKMKSGKMRKDLLQNTDNCLESQNENKLY